MIGFQVNLESLQKKMEKITEATIVKTAPTFLSAPLAVVVVAVVVEVVVVVLAGSGSG